MELVAKINTVPSGGWINSVNNSIAFTYGAFTPQGDFLK